MVPHSNRQYFDHQARQIDKRTDGNGGEERDTRLRYEIPPRVTLIEAARTGIGEQLPRYFPALREAPPEIRELAARLVALDHVKQRAEERRSAERRAAAFLPLRPLQLPQS